ESRRSPSRPPAECAGQSWSRPLSRLFVNPSWLNSRLASLFDVARFIPQPDHRSREAVFVAQGAQTGGAEHEGPGLGRQLKAEPADGQHAKEVAAGEQQHVALDRAQTAHGAVSPRGNLGRRFPPRAAVAKQLPVRALGAYLGCAPALIRTVV